MTFDKNCRILFPSLLFCQILSHRELHLSLFTTSLLGSYRILPLKRELKGNILIHRKSFCKQFHFECQKNNGTKSTVFLRKGSVGGNLFSLVQSFENAICKDYITEKTYNALRRVIFAQILEKKNRTITQFFSPHKKKSKKKNIDYNM